MVYSCQCRVQLDAAHAAQCMLSLSMSIRCVCRLYAWLLVHRCTLDHVRSLDSSPVAPQGVSNPSLKLFKHARTKFEPLSSRITTMYDNCHLCGTPTHMYIPMRLDEGMQWAPTCPPCWNRLPEALDRARSHFAAAIAEMIDRICSEEPA